MNASGACDQNANVKLKIENKGGRRVQIFWWAEGQTMIYSALGKILVCVTPFSNFGAKIPWDYSNNQHPESI